MLRKNWQFIKPCLQNTISYQTLRSKDSIGQEFAGKLEAFKKTGSLMDLGRQAQMLEHLKSISFQPTPLIFQCVLLVWSLSIRIQCVCLCLLLLRAGNEIKVRCGPFVFPFLSANHYVFDYALGIQSGFVTRNLIVNYFGQIVDRYSIQTCIQTFKFKKFREYVNNNKMFTAQCSQD